MTWLLVLLQLFFCFRPSVMRVVADRVLAILRYKKSSHDRMCHALEIEEIE